MRGYLILYNDVGKVIHRFHYFHRLHRNKEIKKWRKRYGNKVREWYYHLIPFTNEKSIKKNGQNKNASYYDKRRARNNALKEMKTPHLQFIDRP